MSSAPTAIGHFIGGQAHPGTSGRSQTVFKAGQLGYLGAAG